MVVDPCTRALVHTVSKPIENKDFQLFGTLHGLVCLYEKGKVVLWNPMIRKFSIIPAPSVFHGRDYYWYPWSTCYGFWIDPCSKEFKIVILWVAIRQNWNCILYSSIRQNWSAVPVGKLENWNSLEKCPPLMIGGVAHWRGYIDKYNVILSFDFVQESFDVIAIANLYLYKTIPFRWQGRLAIVDWKYRQCECEVYLRQEHLWVKMASFEVPAARFEHVFWAREDTEDRRKKGKRKRESEERIGSVVAEHKENVSFPGTRFFDEVLTPKRDLILYGTKTGCATVKRDIPELPRYWVAYDFVESLLFP